MALPRESSDDDDELIPDKSPDQQTRNTISGIKVTKFDDIIHDEVEQYRETLDDDGDVAVSDGVSKRRPPPPPPHFKSKDEPDQVMVPDFINLTGDDDDDDKKNDSASSSLSTTPVPVREARGVFRDASCQIEHDEYLSEIFQSGSGLPKPLFVELVPDTDFKSVLVAMYRYTDHQSAGDALCANIRDMKTNVNARAQELRDLRDRISRGPGQRVQFLLKVAPLCMSYTQYMSVFLVSVRMTLSGFVYLSFRHSVYDSSLLFVCVWFGVWHPVRESTTSSQRAIRSLERVTEASGFNIPDNIELRRVLNCIIPSFRQNKRQILAFLNDANRAETAARDSPLHDELKKLRAQQKDLLISLIQMANAVNETTIRIRSDVTVIGKFFTSLEVLPDKLLKRLPFKVRETLEDFFGAHYRRKSGAMEHIAGISEYTLWADMETTLPSSGGDHYGMGEDPHLPFIREVKGKKLVADASSLSTPDGYDDEFRLFQDHGMNRRGGTTAYTRRERSLSADGVDGGISGISPPRDHRRASGGRHSGSHPKQSPMIDYGLGPAQPDQQDPPHISQSVPIAASNSSQHKPSVPQSVPVSRQIDLYPEHASGFRNRHPYHMPDVQLVGWNVIDLPVGYVYIYIYIYIRCRFCHKCI